MTATAPKFEHEIAVLQSIYEKNGSVRQRHLAKAVGLSLGMTNSIIKRLVQIGWLSIKKVNSRNIHYIVSKAGIDEITRRSFRYLKRTIKNILDYRIAIERFIRQARTSGFGSIKLIGRSDIDFIVEHVTLAAGIKFIKDSNITHDGGDVHSPGTLLLYSEAYVPDLFRENIPGTAFLLTIMSGCDTLRGTEPEDGTCSGQ